METMSLETFREYWFGTFAVVAVLDDEYGGSSGLEEGRNWEDVCLGTFYIKPNYPGMYLDLLPTFTSLPMN